MFNIFLESYIIKYFLDNAAHHFKHKLPEFRIETKRCEWKHYGMHERGEKRKDGIFVFNFRNNKEKGKQNKKDHDYKKDSHLEWKYLWIVSLNIELLVGLLLIRLD